jgi:hypothetical protein
MSAESTTNATLRPATSRRHASAATSVAPTMIA